MTDVTMPGFSDSMKEGTVARWLKDDGEHVEPGDELLEIETDKATMSYEAEVAGLLRIVVAEGTAVPVGAVIGRIGEASDGGLSTITHTTTASPVEVGSTSVASGEVASASTETASSGPSHDGPVRATPLARLLAGANGIDLSSVVGTGPRGRVTRSDVAFSAGIAPTPVWSASPPAAAKGNGRSDESVIVQDLTPVQQVVARRMAEAKATVPEFQVQTEVVMDAVLALREQLRPLVDDGKLPSLNDFIVKASALALRQHPRANGSYRNQRFELYPRVNVGVAVAGEDALVVPVVADADSRSLSEVAAETRRLAELVRSGGVTLADLSEGTFTVSNLGMFGMTSITPVINPPQAAILGVGSTREVLALHDDKVVVQHLMTLTLTCDHRILYGADAARFLSTIRELLEEPLRLLL